MNSLYVLTAAGPGKHVDYKIVHVDLMISMLHVVFSCTAVL